MISEKYLNFYKSLLKYNLSVFYELWNKNYIILFV